MKTFIPKKDNDLKEWKVLDAKGKVLGRVAARAASILQGKSKPEFTPFLDVGDNVIIVNAADVRVTGNKRSDKVYYRHSGYTGGLKSETLGKLLESKPEEAVRRAIVGMLPKNRRGRKLATNLKVYAGPEHPHEAQAPETVEV